MNIELESCYANLTPREMVAKSMLASVSLRRILASRALLFIAVILAFSGLRVHLFKSGGTEAAPLSDITIDPGSASCLQTSLSFDECDALARETFPSYQPVGGDSMGHSEIKLPRCELAVVMAGSSRSGSTLLLKIITDCVKRLSEHLGVKWASIGYWRMHRHLRESPQKDLAEVTQALSRIHPDTQIVILKSHEYDPDLFKLCKETFVVTSTTDVGKAMKSYVAAGWSPNDCTYLRAMFHDQLRLHRCWQKHSRLRFHYRDFESDKRLTAVSIMTRIVELLKIPTDTYLRNIDMLFNFSSDYMREEANPNIPGQKSDNEVDCQVERFLEAEFSGKSTI